MNAEETMKMDKADLVWRILKLESKVEAQEILIKVLKAQIKEIPQELSEGSLWKYESLAQTKLSDGYLFRDCTLGKEYVVYKDGIEMFCIKDDANDPVDVETYQEDFKKHFSRVR